MVVEAIARTSGERLLWTWGAQIRGRMRHRVKLELDPKRVLEHPAVPYDGNVEAGRFRRRCDAHPHAHIVAHVETALMRLSETHRAYAVHRYILGMGHADFPGSEWSKRKLREELTSHCSCESFF